VSATPALIAAAAGVGFGHAVLPDHWVPLAVVGRTQRYPLSKVARLSGLAGVAHVLVSIVLGAVVIGVGLQFRSTVEHAQDTIVGLLLIATGIGFLVLELLGRGHGHSHGPGGHHHHHHGHDHDEHSHAHDDGEHSHDHDHGEHAHAHDDGEHPHSHPDPAPGRFAAVASIMVPFGAAASPDLTILPVFLAATTAGAGAALGALVVFAAVTIGTIVGLTLFATAGGYRIEAGWLDRWGNLFTAAVLIAIGLLVLTGVV
jgi:ABC-type nickel/cobalt efflux system permease component RcnA